MTDKLKEAFPYLETGDCGQRAGMLLRDYFAAKAMAYTVEHCSTYSRAAEEAYKIADALMEARE